MNFISKDTFKKPIVILITLNILVGLFVFRDYGLAWDEPLFYSYGDALGYAYSPKEWFSGNFDLYNSYGASGDDHKNRGPAYLFLSRNFVYGLEALGADSVSAWHLVNFLFFQLGIYFLYRLSKRWMGETSAFFTSVFFSFQPLLWGHAFLNPKDPPFMTFFLASVCIGFEMVDMCGQNTRGKAKKVLLASFFLGIATSIRVLGPLAGVLVLIYFLSKRDARRDNSAWRWFILYGIASILVMIITWPYLWENPVGNFFSVLKFMSDNPTQLGLLFEGEIYRANNLPLRYFPFMFATTLTEPLLPLFALGLILGYWKYTSQRSSNIEKQHDQLVSLSLILSWFLILVAYILIRRPAMYDGIRHFLFILPPVFIFVGLAHEYLMKVIGSWQFPANLWLRASLSVLLLLPGVYGMIKLHPYQYTYYNFYIGGTSRAFRTYETDYWLTCYKDAVEELNKRTNTPVNLYVKREPYLALSFADEIIRVDQFRGNRDEILSGDYVLTNSRTNDDLYTLPNAPIIIEIGRVGAKFCVIRQIP